MDKPIKLYTILSSIFLSALILAEITGGKLLQVGVNNSLVFTMTMGVIPFPVTFIVTDIINEYFGRRGIRFITFVGMSMVLFVLILLQIDMAIPAAAISPVPDEAFNAVFGISARIIVGSLVAYMIGQLVDIYVFHFVRKRTGGKLLWLRATGSTIVSQLFDSFVVLFIAFSGTLATAEIVIGRRHQLSLQIRDCGGDYAATVSRPRGGGSIPRQRIGRAHDGNSASPEPTTQDEGVNVGE